MPRHATAAAAAAAAAAAEVSLHEVSLCDEVSLREVRLRDEVSLHVRDDASLRFLCSVRQGSPCDGATARPRDREPLGRRARLAMALAWHACPIAAQL